MATKTHWLWPAFQNLVEAHHLTSQEAIEKLSELYPSLEVLNIVTASAGGPKQEQQAQEPDSQDFNAQIRARAAGHSNEVTDENPGPDYDPAQDFIRQRVAARRGE